MAFIAARSDVLLETCLATLGPKNTCSELTAKLWLAHHARAGSILLQPSFEEACACVVDGEAAMALVASAYTKFNELVFCNLSRGLRIVDCFMADTPNLVYAIGDAQYIQRIACMPAPRPLINNLKQSGMVDTNVVWVETAANPRSADKVVSGEADGCITTLPAAQERKLNVRCDFGPVPMSWNIFAMKDRRYT